MTRLRKIFLLPLKNCLDLKKFDTLLQFVSKEKADRIKKHYNNTDKKLSLYAQLAVKLIVNKEYGIDINRITIITDDFGKPYISEYPDIYFNISHTHNIIAIGFSYNPVGIDIEKKNNKSMDIAKRFFTQNEYEYIRCNKKNQNDAFLEIWTKKESYIKCSGIGLRMPLKDFCVMDKQLNDKFITLKKDEYVVSFYDGIYNKELPLIELTEEELENLYLNY